MKLRVQLWAALAARERGAMPLVGAAWGVTARKAIHNGMSLRAIWDATLVVLNNLVDQIMYVVSRKDLSLGRPTVI